MRQLCEISVNLVCDVITWRLTAAPAGARPARAQGRGLPVRDWEPQVQPSGDMYSKNKTKLFTECAFHGVKMKEDAEHEPNCKYVRRFAVGTILGFRDERKAGQLLKRRCAPTLCW